MKPSKAALELARELFPELGGGFLYQKAAKIDVAVVGLLRVARNSAKCCDAPHCAVTEANKTETARWLPQEDSHD